MTRQPPPWVPRMPLTPDYFLFWTALLKGSDSMAVEGFITFTHLYQAIKILSTYLQLGTR